MGDFAGDSKTQKPLKDRKFTTIDRDNFNEVMAGINPRLTFQVDDTLGDGDKESFTVNLEFKAIEDFEPARVAQQIEPLRKLLDRRNELRDLLTKVDRSEDLEDILERVVKNTKQLDVFSTEFKPPEAAPDNERPATDKES
jgi:type VI secretion system protein ImpB